MEDRDDLKEKYRKEMQSRVARAMRTGIAKSGNVFVITDIARAYEYHLKRPLRKRGVTDDNK